VAEIIAMSRLRRARRMRSRREPDAWSESVGARRGANTGSAIADPVADAGLQVARRPAPEHLSHQEPEIEGARVDDEPLEDVRMSAQVDPAQPAGVIDVRKRRSTYSPRRRINRFPWGLPTRRRLS
jgi:hypothetical protein